MNGKRRKGSRRRKKDAWGTERARERTTARAATVLWRTIRVCARFPHRGGEDRDVCTPQRQREKESVLRKRAREMASFHLFVTLTRYSHSTCSPLCTLSSSFYLALHSLIIFLSLTLHSLPPLRSSLPCPTPPLLRLSFSRFPAAAGTFLCGATAAAPLRACKSVREREENRKRNGKRGKWRVGWKEGGKKRMGWEDGLISLLPSVLTLLRSLLTAFFWGGGGLASLPPRWIPRSPRVVPPVASLRAAPLARAPRTAPEVSDQIPRA